jgi:hypothetical protein
MHPQIEETCKVRAKMVVDFDSYRRRLKTLEAKKISIEATAKEKVLLDLNTEIAKYTAKVSSAEQAYTEFNEKTKGDIIVNRVSHDELLDSLLVTSIVCQAELYARMSKELNHLLQLCPPQQVADVRKKIEDLINKGGPPVVETEERRFFRRGAERRNSGSIPPIPEPTGTNDNHNRVPHQLEEREESQPLSMNDIRVPGSQDMRSTVSQKSEKERQNDSRRESPRSESNPFGRSSSQHTEVPATPTGVAASPTPAALPLVVALYDHEADAADELNFSAGDHVEVLYDRGDNARTGSCYVNVYVYTYIYIYM